MPTVMYFTLISIGVFLYAAVNYGAYLLFSPSHLFFKLIGFSLACILFSVLNTASLLSPMSLPAILGVQIGYSLLLCLNPFILLTVMEHKRGIRRFLYGLAGMDLILFALVIVAALFLPQWLRLEFADGRWQFGIMRKIRAVVGILNWIPGAVVVLIGRQKEKGAHFNYFFAGYIFLAIAGLLDTVMVLIASGRYDIIPGHYPGLLTGMMLFHLSVTLTLSQRFRDQELESKASTNAMQESKKELMRMAYYDDMTNRPNRKSFFLHLNHHIIETLSFGKVKSVFLVDLDNFRDINDTFGYSFGDKVIQDVGERIEVRFGIRDRLYRLYGNRFAIIWDDVGDRSRAVGLAREILEDLTSLVEIDRANLYMGVSLGAVMIPEDGEDVSEIFRRCEAALAEAKRDKNTYYFYSEELENIAQRKMSVAGALRAALKNGLFHVVYQPIVRSDGVLAEVEALIRCSHPYLKGSSPELYIGVAESSGLIIPITWWLISQVLADAARLRAEVGDIRINVNMSPKILKSRDLPDHIVSLVRNGPGDGGCLGFEITEGAIIENVEQVLANLKGLRSQGYKISLDDFGTGYSSLSYIKDLPLDKIKIDKKFISGIARDPRDEALVNSIISIADNLHMDLVAEGVESPEQLRYLDERGCGSFQGYYFSKPLSMEDLLKSYAPGGIRKQDTAKSSQPMT